MLLEMNFADRVSYDSPFWDTPYSIVVVLGAFILLYVLAAIFQKKKQSNKQLKNIIVRVESIRKAPMQISHGNISIDGMRNGRHAAPGTRCEVTFVEDKTGEIFVFTISERVSAKFSVGDIGQLKYIRDEFLSFSDENSLKNVVDEVNQYSSSTKKTIKRKIFTSILIFSVMSICALIYFLNQEEDKNVVVDDVDGERVLVVYLSGSIMNYGEDDEYITSWYQLGDMPETTEKWGEAYIYRDAIEQYKKQTNEEIVVKFFSSTEEMLRTSYDEWKKGNGPDVLIGDYRGDGYCLYPYIEEGMFEDFQPYFEQDEIYSGGQYVSRILEAGIIGDQQLIFPLTFNMNVLFTSKERMTKHEMWLSDDMHYEDMLEAFRNGWREARYEDEYLMVQFTNIRNNYPYILFQAASGVSPIDYETGKVTLSKELFTEWATLYQSYICNEYDMTREELKYLQEGEGIQEKNSKYGKWQKLRSGSAMAEMFGLLHEDVLCFAEGGNCSGFYHSFAANARYFESRFDEFDDDMICIGIPTQNNPDGYAAQVTTFGVVLSNSPNTDKGYEFIKTLADSEIWMHFDLSVNRQRIEDTLSDFTISYYDYYPMLGRISPEKGSVDSTEWLDDPIKLKPMSIETKEYLEYMIDQVEVAILPEFGLNTIITEEIQNYLWGDTDNIEEAYKNTIQRFAELGYNE